MASIDARDDRSHVDSSLPPLSAVTCPLHQCQAGPKAKIFEPAINPCNSLQANEISNPDRYCATYPSFREGTDMLKPITTALVCLMAIAGFSHTAFAQNETQNASTAPLAVGLTNGGAAEAQVIEAVRRDDILTIKLRFKPLITNKLERIYDSISETDYQNSFYVLSGNKKHLLLKDSNDQPLTNPNLVIKTTKDSPTAGSWHGRFPAPPKDITEVSLTIPGVETLEAIKITDQ